MNNGLKPVPVEMAATKSRYHLTSEQINLFDDNGYLILQKRI